MNNVVLIGRLTRDPELRYTPSSQMAVAHFTLAVDRPVQNGQERQADFIRITVFGKQAETADRYLFKGSQVAVNGRIQTGQYKDRNGQTVYTTDVIANRVEFLGSRNSGGGSNNTNGANGAADDAVERPPVAQPQDGSQSSFDDAFPEAFSAVDDDIPF